MHRILYTPILHLLYISYSIYLLAQHFAPQHVQVFCAGAMEYLVPTDPSLDSTFVYVVPPCVFISEVYRLSKQFHLDVSLFERLIHNGADHATWPSSFPHSEHQVLPH